jgi:hypothetical protein
MRKYIYIYIYTMWILRIVALSRIAVMVRAHFAQWDKTQYSHKTVVNTDEQRMFEDRPELRHGITPGAYNHMRYLSSTYGGMNCPIISLLSDSRRSRYSLVYIYEGPYERIIAFSTYSPTLRLRLKLFLNKY